MSSPPGSEIPRREAPFAPPIVQRLRTNREMERRPLGAVRTAACSTSGWQVGPGLGRGMAASTAWLNSLLAGPKPMATAPSPWPLNRLPRGRRGQRWPAHRGPRRGTATFRAGTASGSAGGALSARPRCRLRRSHPRPSVMPAARRSKSGRARSGSGRARPAADSRGRLPAWASAASLGGAISRP